LTEAAILADTRPPGAWPVCAALMPHAQAVLDLTSDACGGPPTTLTGPEGTADRAGWPVSAGVIRTAAPLIERTGVATAEEIDVETFAQRLRDELQMNQAVFAYPMLLSAWGTTDGATSPRPAHP
jgi:hypothetical protein